MHHRHGLECALSSDSPTVHALHEAPTLRLSYACMQGFVVFNSLAYALPWLFLLL